MSLIEKNEVLALIDEIINRDHLTAMARLFLLRCEVYELPPAEQPKTPLEEKLAEREWIPVSERLPEKDDLVLVTVWNDVVIAWRNRYGGWESAEDMYEKGDVIAWMPLPEPYKERRTDE